MAASLSNVVGESPTFHGGVRLSEFPNVEIESHLPVLWLSATFYLDLPVALERANMAQELQNLPMWWVIPPESQRGG